MIDFDRCAIGTMAWGKSLYGRIVQGNSVDEKTLIDTLNEAKKTGMLLIDTAHKYGFGYSEKIIGRYGDKSLVISTKFTPGNRKKPGSLTEAFYQDLKDLNREYVDIYWLHLPIKIHQNLMEMIALVKQGKIKHVGVSNFNFNEVKEAKTMLEKYGISLYGVQNHYSLLSRDWEDDGLINWCHENNVKFYAWSVMEQGALTGKPHYKSFSIRGFMYNHKLKKMQSLFKVMEEVGQAHNISIAQVNIVWALSKNIVPICGCRKQYQVTELSKASQILFTKEEIKKLEDAAKATGIHIKGDMFRKALKLA